VRVIDADSDQILHSWAAHDDWIYGLAISPDGQLLATGDWKGIVKTWDVREAVAKLKQEIEFDAIDGQAVDIVFVLLLPAAAESGQIGALALVARALRPLENLVRLRGAKNASELYSVIA